MGDWMIVRKALPKDLPEIVKIYEHARAFMRQNGNPNQWGNNNPPISVLERDIHAGQLYLLEEGAMIQGVFAFIIGEDPTYRVINGAWHSDEIYGTIHRIASAGKRRGIFPACVEYCEKRIGYLRIDTHEDNRIMQQLVEKHGFWQCGIIHLADGSPRIAYDRL